MATPYTTIIAMISGALLLVSAATPTTAGDNAAGYSTTLIAQTISGEPKRSGYSQALIKQALKARDASQPGDELDECVKANKGNGDYIEVLGGCFCLTTDAHNPACGQEYEPED